MLHKILLAGAAITALLSVSFLDGSQDEPMKAADALFSRKEYAAALASYQAAAKLPEFAKDREHIHVRIGITLARLERHDEALAALKSFVDETPSQPGTARALLERGVIAASMPHNAFEKDGKRTRGQWTQGATYIWTADEDYRSAVADLERATDVFARLIAAAPREPAADRKQLVEQGIRAWLELCAVLEAGQDAIPAAKSESAAATKPLTWADRMIQAFDRAIDAAKAIEDREAEALCRYMKGAACVRLLDRLPEPELRDGEIWHRPHESHDAVVRVKLPADRNPLVVLADAADRARGTRLAAETATALARLQQRLELFVDSVKAFESIVRDHPKSPYAEDARQEIEEMTFPRIALQATHARLPGAAFDLEVTVRNVKEVTVTVSAIPLDRIYTSAAWLEDRTNDFGNPEQTYAALSRSGATVRPVATIKHATGDDGRHRPLAEKIGIPALESGAYLVEATSGALTWRSLVLVSDLSVAAKFDRERIVTFAVDAITGKPVAGAQVVIRQTHRDNQKAFVRHDAGVSDANGLFVRGRDFGDAWTHVECVAVSGNRIAMIDRAYWHAHARDQQGSVAYMMTDRPVYRPGDPIRIAAVVRNRLSELEYQALANRSVRMVVSDPKGQQIFDQRLKTDESGAFSQEIVVGKDAPLGVYHVQLDRDGRHIQGSSFRIEEYLKPEFEVTIGLPKEQVRLGSKVPVTIDAQYYFGGGVPGAEVTWRVFREEYAPAFTWQRHWMFDSARGGFGRQRRGGRELVVSGQGALSGDGKLEIAFETAPYAAVEGDGSTFYVEADVMDASRRTISGSGSLLIAKTALVLGVQARRGFYVAGDNVECETQSKLPVGTPVAATGTIRVLEITQTAKPDGRIEETRREIHSEPHTTDAKGVGFFRWQPDAGGYFAIVFEALDRFEQLAKGETTFWIYKAGNPYRDFAFANIELVPDRRTYEPGQVAKVLIRSALPEGSVLWSVEAGDRMLSWNVLPLDGRLGVIEIPIERGHAPNIHVHVLAVAGGKFFEDRVEIFVPPEDRFLDVKLAFAKDPYRPGDAGELVVSTATSTGAPVAARVAVTVLDASILAIQSDDSADIRQFFYGTRRHANTQRESSAGLTLGGYLARDVKWGDYKPVGGLPAWHAPEPGFVSRLLRGEGFGLKELESWGVDQAKANRSERGGMRMRRAAGRAGADGEMAAAPALKAIMGRSDKLAEGESKDDSQYLGMPEGNPDEPDAGPKTRRDFRDSALWTAEVATDASGKATVKVPFPESLTTWRAKAWAWTPETLVGQTTADVKTTKDVLIRLRAPRFFVEGDAITVAALVNNRTAKALSAKVKLTLDEHLRTTEPLEVTVEVAPNSDRRIDWLVDVVRAGTTRIAAQVVADADLDALEMTYPVLEWGKDKVLTRGAVLEGDAQGELQFTIPAERRAETTSLELSMQPSLLLTLMDALPYLIDFPYGCTEQTTSRFIPAAIVAKLLGDAGVTLEDIAAARGGAAGQRDRDHARVLSTDELQRAVRGGLERLASMQHGDGGFGWWKDGQSSGYLSAYVLQGLLIAREADLPVPATMVDRAVAFLTTALPAEQQLEQATFMAYVLARAGKADAAVLDRIFRNRDSLNVYGKALLASAMKAAGKSEEAALTLRNLADFAVRDAGNGTAHWNANSRQWWWWWNNLVETNAAVLNAFVDVDPGHELARPLVKWLVTNRRGGRWSNTRDTAQSIFALARYAKASGELDPDMQVEVRLAGVTRTFTIDKKNVWTFDGRTVFGAEAVPAGDVRVAITTRGKGRLYVTGFARFFTKEADITGAGNDLLVARSYVRVTQKPQTTTIDGRDVVTMTEVFEPLASGAEIRAGDVVEVRLEIEAKNDYDYLFFEDMKPAGFEPLETKSGSRYGAGICSNVEYRDTRTAMFVTYLQQGKHTLGYQMRAEIPGTLRTLPARGEAMYAPDIAGTSSSMRFSVLDRAEK